MLHGEPFFQQDGGGVDGKSLDTVLKFVIA
jgi:hypothetical protein